MTYLFDEKLYTNGPMTFKLPEPVKVKLKDLNNFLENITPHGYKVFMIERFEYGDFDNWVTAIIRDKTVTPRWSNDKKLCVKTDFWMFYKASPDKKFWKECPDAGYHDEYNKTLDTLEVEVEEVFIISNKDFY